MPRENLERQAEELIGELYEREELPDYPGRIYLEPDAGFFKGFPYVPVEVIEVRFAEASVHNDVFRVDEARAVDTSNPEDVFGEWYKYEY